jgi:hypothetical protein
LGALDSLRFTWGLVGLALKAPSVYMRLYFARKRAVGVFRRELVAFGVDRATAAELAAYYPRFDLRGARISYG